MKIRAIVNYDLLLTTSRFDENAYEIKAAFRGTGEMDSNDNYRQIWESTDNIDVDRCVFHPMYEHNGLQYDIAVCHLAQPATAGTPVTLPDAGG